MSLFPHSHIVCLHPTYLRQLDHQSTNKVGQMNCSLHAYIQLPRNVDKVEIEAKVIITQTSTNFDDCTNLIKNMRSFTRVSKL